MIEPLTQAVEVPLWFVFLLAAYTPGRLVHLAEAAPRPWREVADEQAAGADESEPSEA